MDLEKQWQTSPPSTERERMNVHGRNAFVGHVRSRYGFMNESRDLLTKPTDNAKYGKDGRVAIYGLSLSPATSSGVANVCRYSTPACRAGCVALHGNGAYPSVQRGRQWKTALLAMAPELFVDMLMDEIDRAERKHGRQLRVRLNGFSDVRWEKWFPYIFSTFPRVKFYDYTKWPLAKRDTHDSNYRLTYSMTAERNGTDDMREIIRYGDNVSVVFNGLAKGEPIPKGTTWYGLPVIDGDATDDRWSDPLGVIVALRSKGQVMPTTAMPFDWKEGLDNG